MWVSAQLRRQRLRGVRRLLGEPEASVGAVVVMPVDLRVYPAQPRLRLGESGIGLHRLLEEARRVLEIGLLVGASQIFHAAQVEVVGLGVSRAAHAERDPLGAAERHVQRRRHLLRDLRLQPEHLPQRRIICRRPQVAVVPHPDQLRRHPQPPHPRHRPAPTAHSPPARSPPPAPPDRPHRLRACPVLVGTRPADHPEPREPRQPAGDLLGEPVGEVLVARRPQVLERQHRHHSRAPPLGRGGPPYRSRPAIPAATSSAPATAITAPAATAARRGIGGPGGAPARDRQRPRPAPPWAAARGGPKGAIGASDAANASALSKRSSGRRASARVSARSRSSGTSGRSRARARAAPR